MSPKTLFFRRLALTSYVLLLAWVSLWHLWLTEDTLNSAWFLTLLWVIPLLLPLKGLIQGKPYTHAWANFIIMFYLLHGFTAIYTSSEWFYALIELVIASSMFVGCSFFARLRGRELGLGLKKLKES
ncbi:DUF2069 domain-containing protein [Alteromonadaceae bacterium M269]|nr:DUF2069 domain-containing protein [Alteromonadaceae bacterium M269]